MFNRNVEQTPKQGDALESLRLSRPASFDGNENLIKKISEQSSIKNSSASVKVTMFGPSSSVSHRLTAQPQHNHHSHSLCTSEFSKHNQKTISGSSATAQPGQTEPSSFAKSSGSAKMSDDPSEFAESGTSMSSILRASISSDASDGNSCSSSLSKPHKSNDLRWEAIQAVGSREGVLGLSHFKLLKKLGCGNIGSVYLSELCGMKCYFAMKVMDKGSPANRKKLLRARTESEILQSLDHPFLPTLYTHFETDKFSCLVMEFCPGGDLHALRQRRPGKHFSEKSVKFYVSEVLLPTHAGHYIPRSQARECSHPRRWPHHAFRLRSLPSMWGEPNSP